MTSSVPNTVIKDQPRPSFSDEIATANPPDGGLKAWLQVLAAHLMVFNTFGYIKYVMWLILPLLFYAARM